MNVAPEQRCDYRDFPGRPGRYHMYALRNFITILFVKILMMHDQNQI